MTSTQGQQMFLKTLVVTLLGLSSFSKAEIEAEDSTPVIQLTASNFDEV